MGQGVEDDHGKLSDGLHPLFTHKEDLARVLIEDRVTEGVVAVVVGGQVGSQEEGHFRCSNTVEID